MHVVALMKLGAPLEVESVALARDLGVAPYDARMLVTGTPPCVVATLAEDRAKDLAGKMRLRGHGVVELDTARVVAAEDMTSMRRFTLDTSGVGGGEDGRAWLPYEDVFAILRTVHRRSKVHKEKVVERTFEAGTALMTGGLKMTSKKTTEIDEKVEEKEGVVYFFRRSGERPWVLHEAGTRYTGLGPALLATQVLNFQRTLDILRQRMTFATYDDRLVSVKKVPERATSNANGTKLETSSGGGVDLLAHVLASWIASSHQTPYR